MTQPLIDVEQARADTPGCRHVVHLNNAGAALTPRPVLDAVIGHLEREATIGAYEAADEAAERVEHTYDALARLIGAEPHEIAVAENATRAWDMAFYAISLGPGDRILTGRAEYASNVIALLQVATRRGARVEIVDDDEHGQIDVDALRARLDDDVKLIALTHVPAHNGLVNPAEAVGRIARDAGALFLLDACQSVGQLRVDVDALSCDILSAPGRKFLRGPRGTGFLYTRSAVIERLDPPFLDLHAARWTSPDRYEVRDDARRFESWETNYAAKIGLGVAVEYALAVGIDAIEARVSALAARLRSALAAIPGVTVHDRGTRLCGIVTFTVGSQPADEVSRWLREQRINTSVSRHEHAQLEASSRTAGDRVRASVHYYNTDDELGALCDRVGDLASRPGPGRRT
jgi:cysteine desulfurase/selenocysteine lyase